MASIKKDKYDLNVIAREFEKIKNIKNGKATFTAFRFEDFITVLQTSLDFADGIPDVEKRGLVVKSVFECANRGEITRESLLKYINIVEQQFLKISFIDYNILTSISIKYLTKLNNIRINKNNIRFLPNTPSKYDQQKIKNRLNKEGRKIPPYDYTKVIISSRGRSYSEAVNSALDSFEFIRGIWNFLVNRLVSRQIAPGSFNPVNPILLGPIHTLHKKNGQLVSDDYWYEPFFNEKIKIYDLNKQFEYIKSEEAVIRKKIRNLKYGEDIKRAFMRYNNALDYQDPNYTLLNLWSILEFLTSSSRGRYDQTISRTLFRYNDIDLARQVLEHLRDVRNRIVHSNEKDDRARYLVFQLKKFVEDMFLFHIHSKYHFNSLDEAAQLLDLSPDRKILKERIKLFKYARNYRLRQNV